MKLLTLLFLVSFISCSTQSFSKKKEDVSLANETLSATNWFQTSAEAKALYLQGYYLARLSFDTNSKKRTSKPKAIIIDIDETILDNSPYQAKLIEKDVTYPVYWKEWIDQNSAIPLPGALEFLRYVEDKATVFYISNRKMGDKDKTYSRLQKLGFPIKDTNQLLIQVSTSDKSDRRKLVSDKYEIVLLIGDNLNDFDGVFEGKSVPEKEKLVNKMKDDFGKKFIILPNPLYGDWEGALYDYNYKLTNEKKHELRMKALQSF